MSYDLSVYRNQLDTIDKAIVELLADRFEICKKVAQYKIAHGLHVMQPARVQEVKEKVASLAESRGVRPDVVVTLYEHIIAEACRLEEVLIHQAALLVK